MADNIKKEHDEKLVAYYNKFPEEKRLDSRHGQVEFQVTWDYIGQCVDKVMEARELASVGTTSAEATTDVESGALSGIKIMDIGAGTGRYAVPLSECGYDVTAVEFVKYNVGIMKQKNSKVDAYQGDARKLKRFADNTYDVTLLLGPMYHLMTDEDKIRALSEAKRVTKPGGYILVGYLMNEFSILTYGFKEHHILEMKAASNGGVDSGEAKDSGEGADPKKEQIGEFTDHSSYGGVTEDYRVIPNPATDLYDYVRLEDVDRYDAAVGDLENVIRFSPDGASNYMRRELNALSEEEFELFIDYQKHVCERPELLGAGGHIVDVLKKIGN